MRKRDLLYADLAVGIERTNTLRVHYQILDRLPILARPRHHLMREHILVRKHILRRVHRLSDTAPAFHLCPYQTPPYSSKLKIMKIHCRSLILYFNLARALTFQNYLVPQPQPFLFFYYQTGLSVTARRFIDRIYNFISNFQI